MLVALFSYYIVLLHTIISMLRSIRDTYNHLIELRKLMTLEDACKQHLDWSFYFNFFGNDTLYIYNIKDI